MASFRRISHGFKMCTPHQMLSELSSETDEMDRACSMHGRYEHCKHFTQETTREETTSLS